MKNIKTTTIISAVIVLFFIAFLIYPVLHSFTVAFMDHQGISLTHFRAIQEDLRIGRVFGNSIKVSLIASFISVALSFLLAFGINYTNMKTSVKKATTLLIMIPMLLPTITYGFTIIYSIGKQGLFTRLLGLHAPNFYGFNGLLLGYVIYTLPVTFLMINNGMLYIDKRYDTVSKLLGDKFWQRFWITVLLPLLPSLGAALIQAFFMAFTDYGIPAYIGGSYEVISTALYQQMLGTIPNFNQGAAISILMLMPAIVSMILLYYLNRHSIVYDSISFMEPTVNRRRDIGFTVFNIVIIAVVVALFIPIFIVPFTEAWPYRLTFTTTHLQSAIHDASIGRAYVNSLLISLAVAVFGTGIAYFSALITSRSKQPDWVKRIVDWMATISNTIPGMVLGLAFLLVIAGTPLKGTFIILVIANILHYFSTPYLTLKSALSKLSKSWETTAALMGDSYFKTIWRVVTPNANAALLEVMGYYFTNSMVTISAVVFLYTTRTILLTTKIQELQYYNKFNEVFVLSILLFVTNVLSRLLFTYLSNRNQQRKTGGAS